VEWDNGPLDNISELGRENSPFVGPCGPDPDATDGTEDEEEVPEDEDSKPAAVQKTIISWTDDDSDEGEDNDDNLFNLLTPRMSSHLNF
jgi:hypothetical protein